MFPPPSANDFVYISSADSEDESQLGHLEIASGKRRSNLMNLLFGELALGKVYAVQSRRRFHSAFAPGVCHIVCMRAKKQMTIVRTDARRIVASVAYFYPCRNWSVKIQPRNAVSKKHFAASVKQPVPVRIAGAWPFPTVLSKVNLLKKLGKLLVPRRSVTWVNSARHAREFSTD